MARGHEVVYTEYAKIIADVNMRHVLLGESRNWNGQQNVEYKYENLQLEPYLNQWKLSLIRSRTGVQAFEVEDAGWLLFSYILNYRKWLVIFIWILYIVSLCVKGKSLQSQCQRIFLFIQCPQVSIILGCLCFIAWFIWFFTPFPSPPTI